MHSKKGRGKKDESQAPGIDMWLAGTAFALLIIGLVMVYSASSPVAQKNFGNPTHYALRNGVFALLGMVVLAVASRLPMHLIRTLGRYGFAITLFLLLLVLVPGLGMEGGGARRWLNLGFFTMQPSEPFKVMLVLYMAHQLSDDLGRVHRIRQGLFPIMLVYGLSVTLLLAEPDFGSVLISGMVLFGMIFIAGIPFAWITGLILVAIPLAAAGIMMAPYRFRRVTSFLDPWDDPSNSDFQLVQSLLSFGNGGLHGTGLGQGQQKQFYLPESHTDFIFAVIGEELGLFWVLTIILLFAVLIWRAFNIARKATDPFVRLGAGGLTMLIGSQALANMGVVMGLLPPKGLTLPLVSYGGSSLIITMGAVGLLLAFSRTVAEEEKW
ncbi:MAG: putative lipid II flippase FtsW [Magnetococcales bacterium]|nr:putative lipid II flippase FtsW [Magnetococcales bacterium]